MAHATTRATKKPSKAPVKKTPAKKKVHATDVLETQRHDFEVAAATEAARLEMELRGTRRELDQLRVEAAASKGDLNAAYGDLAAVRDELRATQHQLELVGREVGDQRKQSAQETLLQLDRMRAELEIERRRTIEAEARLADLEAQRSAGDKRAIAEAKRELEALLAKQPAEAVEKNAAEVTQALEAERKNTADAKHALEAERKNAADAKHAAEALQKSADEAKHALALQRQDSIDAQRKADQAAQAMAHAAQEADAARAAAVKEAERLRTELAGLRDIPVVPPADDTRVEALEVGLAQAKAALAAETKRADEAREKIVALKTEIRDIKATDARERMLLRSAEEAARKLPAPETRPEPLPEARMEVKPPVVDAPAPTPVAEAPEAEAPVVTVKPAGFSDGESFQVAPLKSVFIPEIAEIAKPGEKTATPTISIKWADGESEIDLPRGSHAPSTDIFHKRRQRLALIAAAVCGLAVACALVWQHYTTEEEPTIEAKP